MNISQTEDDKSIKQYNVIYYAFKLIFVNKLYIELIWSCNKM